jgi:excisionase family DNA binding protein
LSLEKQLLQPAISLRFFEQFSTYGYLPLNRAISGDLTGLKMSIANEQASSLLGQALLDAIRQAVREEIRAAWNGNGHGALLTAEQLAEALQVHKATVYEWVKAKTIPFYQAGRFVRFNLQEVLESQKKKTESPS